MVDRLTPEQRSANMSKIRGRDTKPEMQVRRMLHAEGFRYVLHDKRLPGKPDLVFPSRKKVIFVHGCFWHEHSCDAGLRTPKTNAAFWADKRRRNVERDSLQSARLQEEGWEVCVVWECELKDLSLLLTRLTTFLRSPKPTNEPGVPAVADRKAGRP